MATDNKKLMLICDQTATITLLVSAIAKAATAQGKNYTIVVTSQSHVDEQLRDAQPHIILLTPQLAYLKAEIQRQADEFSVPVVVIKLRDYTQMAGGNILLTAEQFCTSRDEGYPDDHMRTGDVLSKHCVQHIT